MYALCCLLCYVLHCFILWQYNGKKSINHRQMVEETSTTRAEHLVLDPFSLESSLCQSVSWAVGSLLIWISNIPSWSSPVSLCLFLFLTYTIKLMFNWNWVCCVLSPLVLHFSVQRDLTLIPDVQYRGGWFVSISGCVHMCSLFL